MRHPTEDVVNSTTKYIPADMFDKRENVCSTYLLNQYIYIKIYIKWKINFQRVLRARE